MLGVTFMFMGSVLMVLALKHGVLSIAERRVAMGVSLWYAIVGFASVLYWGRNIPQGWFFLAVSGLVQLGLHLTP